ncbi:MAG TPA: hypothetical protein PKA38_03095 [Candidatus Levybacteria bacterium]|nr:hypothetical protein [Candidatus Levybacteria bacterium]
MQAKQSRFSRTTQEKTKKQIFFFIIAIFLLLFVAFQFGPLLLDSVSSLTSVFRKNTTEVTASEDSTLEAPFIDSLPSATVSAHITISGSSTYSDAQVELYVNDELSDTAILADDQKFLFENVKLTEGQNIIRARIKRGNEYSSYTRSYYVSQSKGAPKLDVTSPTEGQQFGRGDQTITVQGVTDPDSNITVNGFRAVVDENGNFSYYLNLAEGENELSIKTQGKSGQETEKKIKVTYKP